MWFKIDMRSPETLNGQIKRGIQEAILRGEVKEDELLPSIREMATTLRVNPNTVARAYRELEAEGVIVARQGMGVLVVENKERIRAALVEAQQQDLRMPLARLKALGLGLKTVQEVIASLWNQL